MRSSDNFIVRLVQEGVLRAGYALSDHTRNALILAIFGFKVTFRRGTSLVSIILICKGRSCADRAPGRSVLVLLQRGCTQHPPVMIHAPKEKVLLCSCWSGGTHQQRTSWRLRRNWPRRRRHHHRCRRLTAFPCRQTPPCAPSADRCPHLLLTWLVSQSVKYSSLAI